MRSKTPAFDGDVAVSREICAARDAQFGSLAAARAAFAAGEPGTIYLDANSVGPMPHDAPARIHMLLEQGWRRDRRRGWNNPDWLDHPRRLGAAVAHLIGAGPQDVLVCDGTSINLYKVLRHALAVAMPRRVVVAEQSVFPTNRYVAEGIARGGLADLVTIESIDQLEAALVSHEVAVVTLSHVDYRSSVRHDLRDVTRLVHRHGATVAWDLSHSAGAVAIDLLGADADYAVASGYKYFCGGPGAPALLYQHPRWQSAAWPAICGWMGHEEPFAFTPDFAPASGVWAQLAATPAVIANTAWSAAADIWRKVDPLEMDQRHQSLSRTLIELIDHSSAECGIEVSSPRDHRRQGGHVALRLTDPAADVERLGQALLDAGVVASTRKPDSLRFALHPLTTCHVDLWDTVERLRRILPFRPG